MTTHGGSMTSDTLLSGFLKDFSLIEVLQVMELGSMTGAINLKQPSGRSAIIYFNQGKMANCAEFDVNALTLGDVLQQLRMATNEQIEHAFSQQLQDVVGKRIGERLVAMRVIDEKQLRDALRTKALWTARELSLWHEGTYEFIAGSNIQKLLPYGEASLDIEVMRVTMEMVRYTDEWETLKASLPQGMQTRLQMSPQIHQSMNFYPRTLKLFFYVNSYHKVRQIACAIQMPELDIARELAQLVQQRLLIPVMLPFTQQEQQSNSKRIPLPNPAEKLRMEDFHLLDLLGRMELTWDIRKRPMERLPALAEFVNWTMDALAETCHMNEIELDPNTLQNLLIKENLYSIGTYTFQVSENHIDVASFTAFCEEIQGNFKKTQLFYEQGVNTLQSMLAHIFETINARVANPRERLENQEVWEAMFQQFAEQA